MSGGRIPRKFIDELLQRVDVVDLIDSYVPLKKTGANYVARCPFHTEKTPSFSVNRSKQFYHCFGCGVSGNAISFLMDFNHLGFVEAVEDLATFAGIEVPRESVAGAKDVAGTKNDLSDLYRVMEQVAAFYVEQLRTAADGKKAVAYLKRRGINSETANEFLLGYAPNARQVLQTRFDRQQLLATGLQGVSDNGDVYDRFRGRLIFPIRDRRGRVIGLGGRVLDDSQPKYLNSPETALFHKGREVYGLYELLKKHARPERILLVEGYMDVIALAQFGIGYAVAALGTAVAEAHFELLFRFSSELVLCFDGDNAGREAAWKAMSAAFCCLKDGRSVRVMLLPTPHDPDSLVREAGIEKFTQLVQSAQVLSDYFFERLTQNVNLSEMEARARLVDKANPYLHKLPAGVFKDLMLARLNGLSGGNALDVLPDTATLKRTPAKLSGPKMTRPTLERQTLALLVQHPELADLVEEKAPDWDSLDFSGAGKFKDIVLRIVEERPASTAVLLESYRGDVDEPIIKQLAVLRLEVPPVGLTAEFNGALARLVAQGQRTRFERLLLKLHEEGLNAQEKEELKRLSALKSSEFR